MKAYRGYIERGIVFLLFLLVGLICYVSKLQ